MSSCLVVRFDGLGGNKRMKTEKGDFTGKKDGRGGIESRHEQLKGEKEKSTEHHPSLSPSLPSPLFFDPPNQTRITHDKPQKKIVPPQNQNPKLKKISKKTHNCSTTSSLLIFVCLLALGCLFTTSSPDVNSATALALVPPPTLSRSRLTGDSAPMRR